jgi:hypothetical protein
MGGPFNWPLSRLRAIIRVLVKAPAPAEPGKILRVAPIACGRKRE